MRVIAETTYTREMLWKYVRFHQLKNPVKVILICALFLYGGGIVVYLLIRASIADIMYNIGPIFVLLVLELVVLLLIIVLLPYRTLRVSKKAIGTTNHFEFTDSQVIATSDSPSASGQSITDYTFYHSIYETKDAFYLFVSPRQALALRKSDIIEGSVDELRQLIKQNVPQNKFHSKLYL